MKHAMTLKGVAMVLLGAALLSGCSTIAVSTKGSMKNAGERLMSIQSDGYALIDILPLWSGTAWVDANGDLRRSFTMFHDRAQSDELYKVAQEYAKAQNCELENVVFMDNYRGIDTANCYGLITIYDISLSAILKERK